MSGAILSREQLGHLRHWDNLSQRLVVDAGQGVSQDDSGGYRFQLAYMTYGLAPAHRQRLPPQLP
jgi:hypothetical protein